MAAVRQRVLARVRPSIRRPGYLAAVRLLWETSRRLSVAVALFTLASAVLPNVVLVAAGRLVGTIPAAAEYGLESSAGQRLFMALAITGGAYAAALLLGPLQSSLSSIVKWRIVYRTQDRLRAADLIVVVDQGRIAAVGDHASLIRAGGLYADLYEIQARAYR